MNQSGNNVPPFNPTYRHIAQDERLSAEALGLLVFLRSLPRTWNINPHHLRKRFRWGRDKAQRVLMELVACGFLDLDKGGSRGGSSYKLRDLEEDEVLRILSENRKIRSPDKKREPEKPDVGKKPRPDNPVPNYINDIQYRNEKKKKRETTSRNEGKVDLSFLISESDMFYRSEIERAVLELGDPFAIWASIAGATNYKPVKTIGELAGKYGLELFAAGVVIGRNDSKNPSLSIRYCASIMNRLSKQQERPGSQSTDDLGSALPDEL